MISASGRRRPGVLAAARRGEGRWAEWSEINPARCVSRWDHPAFQAGDVTDDDDPDLAFASRPPEPFGRRLGGRPPCWLPTR